MQYRPDTKAPIERFVIGTAVRKTTSDRTPSPSVFALDRSVIFEQMDELDVESQQNVLEMFYASESYIRFELGKMYLLAISGENCVGVLELHDDGVILPNKLEVPLESFMADQLGQSFPDYFGTDE